MNKWELIQKKFTFIEEMRRGASVVGASDLRALTSAITFSI